MARRFVAAVKLAGGSGEISEALLLPGGIGGGCWWAGLRRMGLNCGDDGALMGKF